LPELGVGGDDGRGFGQAVAFGDADTEFGGEVLGDLLR
jgi:hypothetical protein